MLPNYFRMLCLHYYDDFLNYFLSKVDVQMPRNFDPFWLILRSYYSHKLGYRQRISFKRFVRRRWWNNRSVTEVLFWRNWEKLQETQLEYFVFGQYYSWAHSKYQCKGLRLYQPLKNECIESSLTLYSLAVSLRTTSFNIQKFYMVLALRWVFCKDLRTNSDFYFVHH